MPRGGVSREGAGLFLAETQRALRGMTYIEGIFVCGLAPTAIAYRRFAAKPAFQFDSIRRQKRPRPYHNLYRVPFFSKKTPLRSSRLCERTPPAFLCVDERTPSAPPREASADLMNARERYDFASSRETGGWFPGRRVELGFPQRSSNANWPLRPDWEGEWRAVVNECATN